MASTRNIIFYLAFLAGAGFVPAKSQEIPEGPARNQARLEGRILNQSDGTPLPSASVALRRAGSDIPSSPDPNEAAYRTEAQSGGVYVFDKVAPGSYRIYADQPGYVRRFYGMRSLATPAPGIVVQVTAGATLKNLDIELVPESVISGRVRNENDEPVPEANVVALRALYSSGHRELFPMASASTDAEGRFALRPLPPGRYYVRVNQSAPLRVAGVHEDRQREALQAVLRTTFYPGAESPEDAVPIPVRPGEFVGAIDFHLKPVKLLRVEGKVNWAGLEPPERTLVLALTRAGFDPLEAVSPRLAAVHQDGTFAFDEVVPGAYYLEPARIRIDPGSNRRFGGRITVEVEDENVTGLKLPLVRTPDLTGRIRIESESDRAPQTEPANPGATANPLTSVTPDSTKAGLLPPPPPGYKPNAQELPEGQARSGSPIVSPSEPTARSSGNSAQHATSAIPVSGIQVRLEAIEHTSINAPKATTTIEGTFLLPFVPPDRYRVLVANLPESTYLKSVVFGGQDITAAGLDLSSASSGELEIVLSAEAAEISGIVRDAKDNALPAVWVSVWPADDRPSQGANVMAATITDERGFFRIAHLSPGKYKVAAWEEIEAGLPEIFSFCQSFNSNATEVKLAPRGRETVAVKPVPAAQIQAAQWQVQ